MPLTLAGDLAANRLRIDETLARELSGSVTFAGSGNSLTVEAPFTAHGLTVHLGGGARVRVAGGCVAGYLEIHVPRGGTVEIGEACAFNGLVRLLAHEPARIAIGRGCLFGADVNVTVSDMHAIRDAATGERLNPARDVSIGERVWIGYRTFVGKGSTVGAGSVIGAQSFLSGAVPPGVLAAGHPVRILRRDIDWTPELP